MVGTGREDGVRPSGLDEPSNRAGDKLRWEVWLGRYNSKTVAELTSVDLREDRNLAARSRTNDRLIVRCSNAYGLERVA
jgi:hypothetical protein